MEEKNLQKVLLEAKRVLILPTAPKEDKVAPEALAMIEKSFNSLGFALKKEDYQKLSHYVPLMLTLWYKEVYKLLEESVGAGVNHKVFYGNFPDFSNMSDFEVELRRILSYLTFDEHNIGIGAVKETERPELKEETEFTYLKLVDTETAHQLLVDYARNYLGSKTAIPDTIKPTIVALYKKFLDKVIPDTFNFKETFVFFVKECLGGMEGLMLLKEASKAEYTKMVKNLFKTPTDVLRFYAAVSDSDIELAKGTKLKSLKRSERRTIMEILCLVLNGKEFIMDDFAAHKVLWLRAAELLHSGEYATSYQVAYKALDDLRSGNYTTYNSKLETALKNKDFKSVINLLFIKPGYFARNLDFLLREYPGNSYDILNSFKSAASRISTPVILQLYTLFNNRTKNSGVNRVFKLKHNKFFSKEDSRKTVPETVLFDVINTLKAELERRFADREPLTVYLSDNMVQYAVPENNRTASSGLKTITFGSKLDLPTDKVLRFFTHWKNIEGRAVDVDLSAEFYTADFKRVKSLAWHDINSMRSYNCFHSGDVRTAPEGASEFIDLDLAELRKTDMAYAVVSICSYSCESLKNIPECFAGYMVRDNQMSGKIFEAKTVKAKFDLTADSRTEVVMIVDIINNKLIWVDMPLGYDSRVAACNNNIPLLLKNATDARLTLKDLVLAHKGHITFITTKEAALELKEEGKEVLIIDDSDDADLTPYDLDTWATWL